MTVHMLLVDTFLSVYFHKYLFKIILMSDIKWNLKLKFRQKLNWGFSISFIHINEKERVCVRER